MILNKQKQELRSYVLSRRNSLTDNQINSKSKSISKKLFSLSYFKEAETIMVYCSFVSEPRTQDIINECIKQGKRTVLPFSVPRTRTILPLLVKDKFKLLPNKYGILEPVLEDCERIDPKEIDLVIVPGVAFDIKGNRLGFGYGYYDKFLKTTSPKCVKIGLAFELQILDNIPEENHDVRVDIIITEKRTIFCDSMLKVSNTTKY